MVRQGNNVRHIRPASMFVFHADRSISLLRVCRVLPIKCLYKIGTGSSISQDILTEDRIECAGVRQRVHWCTKIHCPCQRAHSETPIQRLEIRRTKSSMMCFDADADGGDWRKR